MEQEPQTSVLGLLIIIIRALLLCQNATNRLNIFMINIHASPVLSQTTGCFFYWSALKMTKCQPLKEFSELVLPKNH